MKTTSTTTLYFSYLLLALTALSSGSTAAENDRFARIVLFVDSDTPSPENYEARLASLALYVEAFFEDGLEHWERPIERTDIFARDTDGNIQVTLVKGKLLNPKGKAALPDLRKKATDGASEKLGLKPRGAPVIWWVFYDYEGVKGFQGGARGTGGIAINAYPEGEGLIDVDAELAEGNMNDMAIKGTIHEFGHALGLPHIGPRPDVGRGNSLMGPINRVFWKQTESDDVRVYLTEASAAALWRHPVFQKERTLNPKMPAKVAVEGLTYNESEDGKSIVIMGTLRSNEPAHSVIVYDSERGQFGDYWGRTYVAPIDSDTGGFEATISAPHVSGTIFISFNFETGINTVDGRKPFQQTGSPVLRYTGTAGQREFLPLGEKE